MNQLIRHGSCGKTWTGPTRGHCSQCHETFTQGAFDRHFIRGRGDRPICDPVGRGLVAKPEPWGTLWTLAAPAGSPWWEKRHELAEDAPEHGPADSETAFIDNTGRALGPVRPGSEETT